MIGEKDFGKTAEDRITGFKGVVTGYCSYISGCAQILLSPKVGNDGAKVDPQWVDQQRLELVGGIPTIILDNGETPGADRAAPIR